MQNKVDKPLVYIRYCRKSTEDPKRQAFSIPAQKNELESIQKSEGLNVKYKFKEEHTAWKEGRPVFNEVIQLIVQGKANALLVWKLNRLARNTDDLNILIRLMDSGMLRAITTSNRTYFNNAEDKGQVGRDLIDAKQYSDRISEDVRRGNREKFNQGKWPGGLAKPGYLNHRVYETDESEIIVDKERYPLIKDALKLIINGTHTPMEALRMLNDDWGFRTVKRRKSGGSKLSRASFYRLLGDPFYFGLMIRPEGEKMGKHTPMLTKEEFKILQVRLGRKGKPHYSQHDFPYKNILKCGECGGAVTCQEKWKIKCSNCQKWFLKTSLSQCPRCNTMVDDMNDARISHYIYYSCIRKTNPNCSQRKMVEIKTLEKQATELLNRYEIIPEFKDWAIKYINELNDDEEKKNSSSLERLQKQFKSLDLQLKQLTRLRIRQSDDSYDEKRQAMYDQEEKRLLDEMDDIQLKLKNYQEDQKKWVTLTKDTFNFACHARYWFEQGDTKTKTAILSKLGKNLMIQDGNILIDPYKPFFLIERAKEEIQQAVELVRTTSDIEEKIDNSDYLLSLDPVCISMRRARDSNPRDP